MTFEESRTTSSQRRQLLQVMQLHVGADNGISMKQLAAKLEADERHTRKVISDLRAEGYALCGLPGSGYYMASTGDELESCCQFLRRRAMHSLHLEARLRRMALPDLIEQLRFVEV